MPSLRKEGDKQFNHPFLGSVLTYLSPCRPIYTGFFFKIWDQLFGTENPGGCNCAQCRPVRTVQEWEATVKPDYSVLLSPEWWLSTDSRKLLVTKSD